MIVDFQAVPTNTTDATFRAWGLALSTALQGTGGLLVKTADTGQIDWASVLKGTTNSYPGYEMYRFTDSFHEAGTSPVYIKIEYGTGAGLDRPALRVTVGPATDGAGTLTGLTSSSAVIACGAASTTSYACFISTDGGRLQIGMFIASSVVLMLSICRPKNDSGEALGNGVNILSLGIAKFQQYLPKPGSGAAYPATAMTNFMCAAPGVGTGSYAGNLGVYPIFPNLGYAANPTMGALVYFTGDITGAGSTMEIPMYGVTHTYMVMGGGGGNINGNTTANSLLLRYE